MPDDQNLPGAQPPHPDPQQRVQALEAELQAGQQRAVTFFSEAPAPYLLLDVQGRIVDINAVGCGLLERTRETLLDKRLDQFLTPPSQATLTLLLQQVFEDSLRHQGEVQLIRPDQAPCKLRLDLAPHRVGSGFEHCLVIATDITAYQQAHQSLLDANTAQEQRLQEQALKLRLLNQELENTVVTFIQQLHLPVARVINFLSQLRAVIGEQPQQVTRPLLNTERATQQIIALLASIDRFMQMRRMRVTVRPVDLNMVLGEILKNAQPLLLDRNVSITSDHLPTVQGDSRALYVVLDEYIANALKFTKAREAARIHVRVQETDSEYRIGVEDNGVGFNMRHKDKLFQVFGRLHPSTAYEGTGIGLVTVRRTCERFGGRVWAEGQVDQGATFWFAWPKEPDLLEV